MRRGEIWWAALRSPRGSSPGYRRPVVVVQANEFNKSRIQTVVVAAIMSNLLLGDAPGNFVIGRKRTGLPKKSVVNVSQLLTINKDLLEKRMGVLSGRSIHSLNEGLRLVLSL